MRGPTLKPHQNIEYLHGERHVIKRWVDLLAIKAIRATCLDRCARHPTAVERCPFVSSSLYPSRVGAQPRCRVHGRGCARSRHPKPS